MKNITYISKPTTVEAVRWTGDNLIQVKLFAENKVITVTDPIKILAGVDGAQGWVNVPVGHWIVSQPDDRSDMWPVEDEYFQAKYDLLVPLPEPCKLCDDVGWISEYVAHSLVRVPCSRCNP